jgi:hypothetical protein
MPSRSHPSRLAGPIACCAAAVLCLLVAAGCGGSAHLTEKQRVEAVVHRWLAAERAGDGAAWCDQLSRARRAREGQLIFAATGRHYSCAVMHSSRPPGVREPALYERARRELTEDARVERTTINGNKATVQYSWLASARTNPLINYGEDVRRGNRWLGTVALVREEGEWRIGRS